MNILGNAIVGILMGIAIYTDVKWEKIENRLVIIGWFVGISFGGISGGKEMVVECMKMTILVIAVLLFLFVIKGLGAGDIKLLGMLAAFYPDKIFYIVILSFFAGAGVAIFRMIIRGIRHERIYEKGETLHFSIPIGIAVGIVKFL